MQEITFKFKGKYVFMWFKACLLFIFALSKPYFRNMWRGCRCRAVRGVTKQDFPPSNRCFPVLCIIFQVSQKLFFKVWFISKTWQNTCDRTSTIFGSGLFDFVFRHSYCGGRLLIRTRVRQRNGVLSAPLLPLGHTF